MTANTLDGLFGVTRVLLDGTPAVFRQTIDLTGGWTSAEGEDDDGNPTLALTAPTGGGSAAQILHTRYVDKGTALATGSQTGTIAAPFKTYAQAHAALLALAATEGGIAYGYSIVCYPGDYSAETPASWAPATGGSLTIAAAIPGVFPGSGESLVILPALTGVGTLQLDGVIATGATGFGDLKASHCNLSGTWAITAGTVRTFRCQHYHTTISCTDMVVDGCLINCDAQTWTVSTTAAEITNSQLDLGTLHFSGSAGTLLVDAQTDYWRALNGLTLTNGTVTVEASSDFTDIRVTGTIKQGPDALLPPVGSMRVKKAWSLIADNAAHDGDYMGIIDAGLTAPDVLYMGDPGMPHGLRGTEVFAETSGSRQWDLAPVLSRAARLYLVQDTGTTNSTALTTIATFASMQAQLGNCAGIVRAYVYVQDASNALAMQILSAGIVVSGGALVSGGAGTIVEGSTAQGSASFAYSGNSLLVKMTSADSVAKSYKVVLEVTFQPKT